MSRKDFYHDAAVRALEQDGWTITDDPLGWDRRHRVHGSIIHMDIINGRIWIQYDGTSPGVALDLQAAGVSREDIVLAFKPEHVRPYTDYAVG